VAHWTACNSYFMGVLANQWLADVVPSSVAHRISPVTDREGSLQSGSRTGGTWTQSGAPKKVQIFSNLLEEEVTSMGPFGAIKEPPMCPPFEYK
jgi:hypothetical protein